MFQKKMWKHLSQGLCLGLCVIILCPALAETPISATATSPMSAPLPTPTPEPALTAAPTNPPTQEPTASPTAEPTAEPTHTVAPTHTEAPTHTVTPTHTATVEPTASPATPAPSVSPTHGATPTSEVATPTPSNSTTPTATQEQTPAPAAETATPEPTATPAPSFTPAPTWDENLCDHMNIQCIQAPQCTVIDCEHIGVDGKGNAVALCPLGQWLLEASAAQNAGIAPRSASIPTNIDLKAGNNILYRSGSYVLKGGDQATSIVTVTNGLAVSIELDNASIYQLVLWDDVVTDLTFSGGNGISTIAGSTAKALSIGGNGRLSVLNLNCKPLTVLGGSIQLPATAQSQNGRLMYTYAAANVTYATLDGKLFSYVLADSDNKVYMWLPPLPQGFAYKAQVTGTELAIISAPPEPSRQLDFSLSSPDAFAPVADTAYRVIEEGAPQFKNLAVSVQGVSMSFSGIGLSANAPSVEINEETTLHLAQNNAFRSLNGTSIALLRGDGSLSIGDINVAGLRVTGGLSISCNTLNEGSLLSMGWQKVAVVGSMSPTVKAQYKKQNVALCYAAGALDTVYLSMSAPRAGYHYEATLNGNTLTVNEVTSAVQTLTLDSNDLNLISGNYIIIGSGATGSVIVQDNMLVDITFQDLKTTGNLALGTGANARLVLIGSNQANTLSVADGATLNVSGTGALHAKDAAAQGRGAIVANVTTNLTLEAGAQLAGSNLKPTLLYATDENNQPMPEKELTLKLGREKPFTTTTDAWGHITIWRQNALNNVSAVILADASTYAAIVTGGIGNPFALPGAISNEGHAYNVVTFASTDAKTMGVQYYVSNAEKEMPDTFVSDAKIASMAKGECNLGLLKNGDIVTYRAFSAVKENAELNADTAEAFTFGNKQVYQVKDSRTSLSIKRQTKQYDGKKYDLDPKLITKTIQVVYFHNDKALKEAPTNVGEYVAEVTIPENDSKYYPGVVKVDMRITSILVDIYPEESMKIKGGLDPEFFFTYDTDAMLGDDEVKGRLTRKKGEFYGNYPFLLDQLIAPDYYQLKFAEGSPSFFINWGPNHYLPYDPFKKIDPVYDTLLFSTGKELKTQIRTNEILKIGETYYGTPVTDLKDGKKRPITPTLRLRGGWDQALLILNAEPELNDDGGYKTDADGNKVVSGRRLSISYAMLNNLKRQNIDYLAFVLEGVGVLLPLDNLRSNPALDQLMVENKVSKKGTRFDLVLEPVTVKTTLAQQEGSAADAIGVSETLMRVNITLVNSEKRLDISPVLSGAKLVFDASGLLPTHDEISKDEVDVTETVSGKKITQGVSAQKMQEMQAVSGAKGESETNEEQLALAQSLLIAQMKKRGSTLMYYGQLPTVLDTAAVVPYTSSEAELAVFSALLRTKPYLTTEFSHNGLYGLRVQGI